MAEQTISQAPQATQAPQAPALEGVTYRDSDFASLLTREFKPTSDGAKTLVEQAVQTLAEQALKHATLISSDAHDSIDAMVAELDKRISEQINTVMHAAEFQQVESAWRGLHYLVNNTETDDMLKIRVMNISKNELGKTLQSFKGTPWDQSPIFRKVYEEEYGALGGEPYGCLVGDYYFDNSPPDVELLREMSKVSAAAHAPFIAAASPHLLQMQSWQHLADPRDLTKIFSTPDYAGWRSLRASEDARYIGLAMPRFLARLPYGAKTSPVEEFDFEEDTGGGEHGSYTWANSAYAMAVNINRSFKQYGWCSRIRGVESGGAVEGLPTHTFKTDEGEVAMKCPTEIAIGDRREAELAKNGFMPLLHRKNSDSAAFIGAQSLQKPTEYDDPDATANANLSARLPYLFACCRFAHYLKCIVRDKVGSFKEREDMQRWLTKWVMNYVDGDPAGSSEEVKARKPLADAEVKVEEIAGNPGYYAAKFYLRPHYQLEGLTVSLRLVSKLPSAKAA
ncbi:type VI secretion system contractile sheath large subunit [Paucibacter sp. R3-3]|uniref:Type VI secretion system contractile sheath large subunit n=1 Tax=Roseateles agri TaxID=3098619 RepID=A0ABU5DAM5_9BURK|nr:type VI secretion system contractile sheath large subunit [Paucibacter sp. R3-3]MDY0743278.1 type VI secretion system contractile sheath large subunit [Paucibacter sp. R3-3]